jgi:HlyD family type I secretion membrane fusion protein
MKKISIFYHKKYLAYFLFIIFLLVLFFAPISSVFIAQGILGYDTQKLPIQHLEGGLIEKIYVKNGDFVKKNQDLMVIQNIKNQYERKNIRQKIISLIIQQQILHLEDRDYDEIKNNEIIHKIRYILSNLSNEEISGINYSLITYKKYLKSSLTKYKDEVKIFLIKINNIKKNINNNYKKLDYLRKKLINIKPLVEKNIISNDVFIDLSNNIIDLENNIYNLQSESNLIQKQLNIYRNDNILKISQKILDSNDQILSNYNQLNIIEDIFLRTIIKSPIDGIIENLNIQNNQIILSSTNIMNIIPKNPQLTIVAYVKNKDIDNINLNQKVQIFLTNFHEKNLPKIEGEIIYVAKDSQYNKDLGDYFFEIRVFPNLNKSELKFDLYAGVKVDIYVKNKNRNLISFIFAPIIKSLKYSFAQF